MTASAPVVAPPAFAPVAGTPRAGHVRFVNVPDRLCLAIEGVAQPGGPAFQAAVRALFAAAFPLHFQLRERGIEAPVGHLEGVFERVSGRPAWIVEPEAFAPDAWRWTILISVPEAATDDDLAGALEAARRRYPSGELQSLRVMTVREGRVVEALHVGPYETEPETIEKMRAAAEAVGLAVRGGHHEIWLNDPFRVGPDRTRTVLRLPVR
jgi:hypothetical protein